MLVIVSKVSDTGLALCRFMGSFIIWILVLYSLFITVTPSSIDSDSTSYNETPKSYYINPNTTLECLRREYRYTAMRMDSHGRRCWERITVWSCWGRCDSGEISDWKFPYKRSYHPVCLPDRKRWRTIKLRNCDEEAPLELMYYRYLEAVSCKCDICRSSIASCEGVISLATQTP
ncbi:glycoprotein hormone beta-5-like protein [Dinothrombium tinctorium]|uniref:Glycoprotein hormone beta-5-like protein n=1 Tax=Dinothrombium tinctorium TaxID=1965070 RepID=A0A3S3P7W1_9ACAR|nr:glycoprotein hormone beta-5-like protein [Dinothrombium tinctorium]